MAAQRTQVLQVQHDVLPEVVVDAKVVLHRGRCMRWIEIILLRSTHPRIGGQQLVRARERRRSRAVHDALKGKGRIAESGYMVSFKQNLVVKEPKSTAQRG